MEVLHKYFTAWGSKCVTFGIISLVPLILPDVSDARHGSVQENVSDWEVKLSFHASRVPWGPHAYQAQPWRIARAGTNRRFGCKPGIAGKFISGDRSNPP